MACRTHFGNLAMKIPRAAMGGFANLICRSKEFRIITYGSLVERDLCPKDRFFKVLFLCIKYHGRVDKGLEYLLRFRIFRI